MSEIITLQIGSCGIDIGNAFWTTIMEDHSVDNTGMFISGTETKYSIRNYNYTQRVSDETKLNKINAYFTAIDSELITNGYIRQNIESKTYNNAFNYIPNDVKTLCHSFYGESQKFRPRAILIDSDPQKINDIKTSNMAHLFHSKNFINTATGNGFENNWVKGYCTESKELLNDILCRIHKEIEDCDNFQGFQLCHSIGGGTGSGLASLIIETINNHYPHKPNITFQVYPSSKVSDIAVEPYNAILTISKFLEYSQFNMLMDNDALFRICCNVLKQNEPKYSDLNWLISMAMSDSTACLRFNNSEQLNTTLRRYAMNMCPFPRLQNMLICESPIFAQGQGKKIRLTICEYTDRMWSSRNFYSDIKSEDGKYLSVSNMHRTNYMSWQEVADEAAKIMQKMADDFVTWIPNNIKVGIVSPSPIDTIMRGIMVANTTAIKGVYQRISNDFAKMWETKQFWHLYEGEGMEQDSFIKYYGNVINLIREYQERQDCVVESDWEEDEDEDEEEDEDDYEDEDDEEDDEDYVDDEDEDF